MSNIFRACEGKCCSSKRSLHIKHGVLGGVAKNIVRMYDNSESQLSRSLGRDIV